jgi:murein DD-endopeptidase MepM/ murein hydrolase activator NlpD
VSGNQYVSLFNANVQRIKQARAQQGRAPVSAAGAAFPVVGYQGQVQLHWGEDAGAADLMAPIGTQVAAMTNGQVVDAGWSDIGGWNVTIYDPTSGLTFYYAHLANQPLVQRGQALTAGSIIGQVGDTGNAKGGPSHLHLGIGYGIQSGTGPRGGSGINFNAVAYLQQVLAGLGQR